MQWRWAFPQVAKNPGPVGEILPANACGFNHLLPSCDKCGQACGPRGLLATLCVSLHYVFKVPVEGREVLLAQALLHGPRQEIRS
jgi:hypothetical protein